MGVPFRGHADVGIAWNLLNLLFLLEFNFIEIINWYSVHSKLLACKKNYYFKQK